MKQKLIKITTMITSLCALAVSVAHAAPLVEKNDHIVFSAEVFSQADALKTVEWSQNFSKKKAQYLQITAAVESDAPTLVMLFIAQPLAELIKAKNCAQSKCKLKIDDRFQYGQNSEKTMRFLVLHDKSNKIYQHRFISTSTLSTFANGAESLAKNAQKVGAIIPQAGLAAATGKEAISALKSLVGDPLRDF